MAYSRTTVVDSSPSGDSVKQAILDLDADVTGAFDGLNDLDTKKLAISTVTTKGDLLAAAASATIVRLGVGSNGQLLTADSSTATGIKWADAPSSGINAFGVEFFS